MPATRNISCLAHCLSERFWAAVRGFLVAVVKGLMKYVLLLYISSVVRSRLYFCAILTYMSVQFVFVLCPHGYQPSSQPAFYSELQCYNGEIALDVWNLHLNFVVDAGLSSCIQL